MWGLCVDFPWRRTSQMLISSKGLFLPLNQKIKIQRNFVVPRHQEPSRISNIKSVSTIVINQSIVRESSGTPNSITITRDRWQQDMFPTPKMLERVTRCQLLFHTLVIGFCCVKLSRWGKEKTKTCQMGEILVKSNSQP